MIANRQIIDQLYKRFSKRPATLDERNLSLLADFIVDERGITLDEDSLVFTEAGPMSPFREIKFDNLHGVADLGGLIAIVMHSSIIFFNKENLSISVHLRPPSRWERIVNSIFSYLRKLRFKD